MSGKMKRGRPKTGMQSCDCGYSTMIPASFKRHKMSCTMKEENFEIVPILAAKDEIIANLKEELEAKNQQIKELIQIAKKPRINTVNNITVDSSINTFGKESIKHINPEQIKTLLADPANAVSQFIKLKHRRAPGCVNHSIRVPNKNRAIYKVVAGEGEEKEWENKTKGEVLEELYDDNSGHLEAEADEETCVGSQFFNHQEKVKASASGEDGGRRYKEQLDKIHFIICNERISRWIGPCYQNNAIF